MSPMARHCSRHGRIVLYGSTCPDCAFDQPHRRRDPRYAAVMDSYRWRKVRAAARRRDGGCLLRDDGRCQGRIEVHHIQRVTQGGEPYALSNLATLCRRHHSERERRGLRGDSGLTTRP